MQLWTENVISSHSYFTNFLPKSVKHITPSAQFHWHFILDRCPFYFTAILCFECNIMRFMKKNKEEEITASIYLHQSLHHLQCAGGKGSSWWSPAGPRLQGPAGPPEPLRFPGPLPGSALWSSTPPSKTNKRTISLKYQTTGTGKKGRKKGKKKR